MLKNMASKRKKISKIESCIFGDLRKNAGKTLDKLFTNFEKPTKFTPMPGQGMGKFHGMEWLG